MNAELFKSVIINEEIFYQRPGKILVGTEVAWDLDDEVKRNLANQIHAQLLTQRENMQVIESETLLASMNKGTTVVKIGDNNELLGFAQLSSDSSDDRIAVVETWLGIKHPGYKNGSGAEVMRHAAELAFNSKHFPIVGKVITRVKADNFAPQRVLERIGAEHEATLPSPKTGRQVKVYDLTLVGLRRTK